MNSGLICERREHIYEREVAQRWYALPRGTLLPLSNGDICRLLFAGIPGSAVGPDARDAVLYFLRQAEQRVGDIEFHIRTSDWFTHGHHTDERYNNVILHVALVCDHPSAGRRQNGTVMPLCSLNDLPIRASRGLPQSGWPCQHIMAALSEAERASLLKQAGLLRFEQKTQAFVASLRNGESAEFFSAYDVCLITSLAEGLGYGRDRAFFRAAGAYLLGQPLRSVPEPLDRQRLSILKRLVADWKKAGAWCTMKRTFTSAAALEHLPIEEQKTALVNALRGLFYGLGNARADILICNVVLPFAQAVALIENDARLAEEVQALFLWYPGLSSNRITRAMSAQLSLAAEPEGACQQQGLHYIYQQTCQEKQCELCIVGKRNV